MTTSEDLDRKLAAILSADVAGYSLLMGRDEADTVRRLSDYRAVVIACVERHRGKVDDAKGDALLAEFPSAVNAVACAVEVQEELRVRNDQLPSDRQMHLRIGIHVGDVIGKDDTIYGDGVNIAARLEALAEPGGICVSRMVHDSVKGRLPLRFQSIGKRMVKNIAEPVEVYRWVADGTRSAPSRRTAFAAVATLVVAGIGGIGVAAWQMDRSTEPAQPSPAGNALALPEEPSIAVLPFANLGGKTEEEYFADGMTETLITDLSRLPRLFVIARNSTFSYKGKAVDVRQVGRELGVRYVLEGSIQRTQDRLRVNAQLIEATTGRHLWAERYDRHMADVFEVQDDIARNVITGLDVTLREGEQARVWRKATRNGEAYDLLLRARWHFHRFTREDMARAQELLQEALRLDANFTKAMVDLGWARQVQGDSGWVPDASAAYLEAVALGKQAVALDPYFGDAYVMMSSVLLGLERPREAMAAADRALAVSPNQAEVILNAAWCIAQNGRAVEAVPLVERAFRLNPMPPDHYYGGLGDSLLFAGRVDEAVAAHRKCVERLPDFMWCQIGLTVAYARSGQVDQAKRQAMEVLRINPGITAEDNPYLRAVSIREDRAWVVESLRKAGLK